MIMMILWKITISICIKGSFCPDFFVKNAYAYDEWLVFCRNKVQNLYLCILEEKLERQEDLTVRQAEELFEKYIAQDALEERVYYHMMKIYGDNGLYHKGIRIYHQLKSLLYKELKYCLEKNWSVCMKISWKRTRKKPGTKRT